MSNSPKPGSDLLTRARGELSDMARDGKDHPSTVPIFAGAAIGALAGALVPVLSWPLGLAAGAGFAFYLRIKK